MTSSVQRFAFSSAALIILIAVLLFGGAGSTVYASHDAIPGDILYRVKTTLEQTRTSLARSSADRAELYLEFAGRRMDEITLLIEQGRYDAVAATTDEYESYLNRAIAEIDTVAQGDPARAAQLAMRVSESLTRYSQALSTMMDRVPAPVKAEMEHALQAITGDKSSDDSTKTSPSEMEFSGTVSQMTGTTWNVDGREVTVSAQTEIKGSIALGDTVKVHAVQQADGSLLAREIELQSPSVEDDSQDDSKTGQELEFSGAVDAIAGTVWTVGGRAVTLTTQTEIKGEIALGDTVKVHALQQADGSLIAREIELSHDEAMDDSADDSSDDHDAINGSTSDDSYDDSKSEDSYEHNTSDDSSDDSHEDDSSDDSGGGGGDDHGDDPGEGGEGHD